MGDLFGDGIFAVYGDKWRRQRKLASNEFSTKVLRHFSFAVFRTNAARLAHKFSEEYATRGRVVAHIQDLLMRTTMIFKVGFGIEIDTLSGSDEAGGSAFARAFDEASAITFRQYIDVFWEAKRFLGVGRAQAPRRGHRPLRLPADKPEEAADQGGKHKNGGKEDILSRFLADGERDPEGMSDKYLREIILNFLIAGKDTTSCTLAWLFYLLCKHPLVQEKAAREAADAVGDQQCSSIDAFSAGLTEEALGRMHYLHASTTKTLRHAALLLQVEARGG